MAILHSNLSHNRLLLVKTYRVTCVISLTGWAAWQFDTATTCNQLGSSRVQFASSCAKSRPQLERNLTQLERALTQLERDVCGTRFRVAFEKRCLFHSVLRVPGAHKRARCQPNLGPCYPLPRAQRSRLPVASLLFALPLAPSPFFPLFPFPPCFPLPFLPPFFPLPPLSPLPLALPL